MTAGTAGPVMRPPAAAFGVADSTEELVVREPIQDTAP
jgi:hypothetical protein